MSEDDGQLARVREGARALLEADPATRALGIDVAIDAPGEATATMTVRESMLNGVGVCHGGIIFMLADTAFAFACNQDGAARVSAAGQIDFLRPAHAGDHLRAFARCRQDGQRSGVWDVDVRDQDDRLLALFRGRCDTLRAR